jgi:hypothetical protein
MSTVSIEFDPNDRDDCFNWPLDRAPAFIGVDPAFVRDHTALAVVTVHMLNGVPILAQRDVQVLELGTPSETVLDVVTRAATTYQAKVVVDATNNLALMGRFGREAPKRLIAVNIVTGVDDAITPVPFPVAVAGAQLAIPRFSISRSRTFERLVGEISSQTIRLSKHGDAAILREQIAGIEMIEGGGRRAFDHPSDGHDDAIWAVGIACWAARQLLPAQRKRPPGGRGPKFSNLAWT